MEKRDFCIDFLKGACEQREKCRYGHIIVPDRETFLKTYDSTGGKMGSLVSNDHKVPTYTEMNTKNGKKTIIATCQTCGKGFFFDAGKVAQGEPASLYCKTCLANLS
jgi:hypothetical protein